MRTLVNSKRAALSATPLGLQILGDLLFHQSCLQGSQQLLALRQRQSDILQTSALPF